MNSLKAAHKPVLLKEVLEFLNAKKGEVIIDATFGSGGHSEAILQTSKANVIAIDRDASTKKYFDKLSTKFPSRISYLNGNFSEIKDLVEVLVDGVLMDIGVSSMQLDEAERGFSFTKQARLDMRMNQNQPLTAETIINSYSEKDLADAIFIYGDEKKSRIIAKKIVEARRAKKIESTTELADIIKKAVGSYNDSIHPATRTFQAIRILVNNELEELKLALENAVSVLKNGGKLLVITFHSGEDEIVKKYFNSLTKVVSSSRYDPFVNNSLTKIDNNFINLTKKVVMASEEEIKENPRARSAKLRVIQKINGGKE